MRHRIPHSKQILFVIVPVLFAAYVFAQYQVEVQVVDLQVSVSDQQGNYHTDIKADDFQVWEDGSPQTVLDVEQIREPFSIGILFDTSSSMISSSALMMRATDDFIYSLGDQDEFFILTFDDKLRILQDFRLAADRAGWKENPFRSGEGTRLYDALIEGVNHLQKARYPRRALLVVSDGINTRGAANLNDAITAAQKDQVIIYSIVLERSADDFYPLRTISDETGGSFFILYIQFPRVQAAYEKIASDLAHRFTLYYRSVSDYKKGRRPKIKVQMKNPNWRVRYQKTYFPD
jgi:Ca-activated chloride channel family protein